MPKLQVATHQRAILIDGNRRFYVVWDNAGNAHTFNNHYGHLADQSIHQPVVDGYTCEFLGGERCQSDGRTTAQIHDEYEIWKLLNEAAERVNERSRNA